MEPRKEEPKAPKPRPEAKEPRRFRLIRLEERIAPGNGNKFTHPCKPSW